MDHLNQRNLRPFMNVEAKVTDSVGEFAGAGYGEHTRKREDLSAAHLEEALRLMHAFRFRGSSKRRDADHELTKLIAPHQQDCQ